MAPPAALVLDDHRVRISEALKLPDDADRDAALISALRGVASELEAAEEDRARAEERVSTARELFDWATGALSGYSKTREPKSMELRKRGSKRKGANDLEEVYYDEKFLPPDEGPLLPPIFATAGGDMTEEQVVAHRDAFYQKLCGVPYAELSSFTPSAHLINLKSRAQLEEDIYILLHYTGITSYQIIAIYHGAACHPQ